MHDTPNNTIKHVDYLDGFQYAGEKLQFFPISEGYVSATQDGISIGNPDLYIFNYVYNYTDHLGNIRLSYTKDPVSNELKIMEENHYYPFGLKHSTYADPKQKYELVDNMENTARPTYVLKTDYQYKYNGKELQDELGLNWYDYQARNYDPALGRWMNIDPMGENYYSISLYTYVVNNPLLYIDPTGMTIEDPDGLVKKFKKDQEQSNKDIKGFIKDGLISKKLGNKLVAAGERILSEVSTLEKSDQVYNVSISSQNGGGMSFDLASEKVMIGLGANENNGVIGHELNHAYQFEKGEVSIVADNTGYGSLYDIGDETEAYNRGSCIKVSDGINNYFKSQKIRK